MFMRCTFLILAPSFTEEEAVLAAEAEARLGIRDSLGTDRNQDNQTEDRREEADLLEEADPSDLLVGEAGSRHIDLQMAGNPDSGEGSLEGGRLPSAEDRIGRIDLEAGNPGVEEGTDPAADRTVTAGSEVRVRHPPSSVLPEIDCKAKCCPGKLGS